MNTSILLVLLFAVAAPICTAQSSGFAVDLIHPSRAYLLVDDAWKQNAECLQVKVSVTTEVTEPVLKAYFYDADGKLLHTEKKPSRQTDMEGNQINPQMKFEKGRRYELFFGIPVAAAKWKRAIIVFGKPGEYATKIYPKDDLAKFDFPEKGAVAVNLAPAQKAHVPAQEKPGVEWLALKDPFDARVKLEVQQPFDAGVKDLNARYISALERAQETAQQQGKLEEAVAIKADKEAVVAGGGVPAADDISTLPVVKQLRGTYRVAFNRLEEERARRLQPLRAAFARSLDALVTSLTKEGKLEEAMAVKYEREELTASVAAPAPAVLGQTLGGPKVVITAKATIPSNSPDGYKFGPISQDDLITLKYLEGRWKNHGVIATYSPDDPATEDASRLVISMPSKDGVPGDVIVIVPPSTVLTPFDFKSPITSDHLVLRINADSNNAGNPGAVVYQLQVKRPHPSSAPAAQGQPAAVATQTTPDTKGASLADASIMESEDLVVLGKKFTEGTLRNRELAFSNRGYVWWKVPESASGSRYTKIEGGARPEIKVRAKRDTVVRIFTDLQAPGLNLSGWDRTDLQFTFNATNNPEVVVHEKKLSAGHELDIPQGNWSGALVLLPPATPPTIAGVKAPELPWLIGKTWSTDAGNTLKFSPGGSGERTTKSGKTPFTWRIVPSGLVEVVLKAPPALTLYVEIKSASEGAFGYSESERPTQIHVK